MLFGWYFLLAFVAVSIPAGIYGKLMQAGALAGCAVPMLRTASVQCMMTISPAAKVHYGETLANVDWLHGGAELLLTCTNLFIGEAGGGGHIGSCMGKGD